MPNDLRGVSLYTQRTSERTVTTKRLGSGSRVYVTYHNEWNVALRLGQPFRIDGHETRRDILPILRVVKVTHLVTQKKKETHI